MKRVRDDVGASLILVMIFIFLVSVIATGVLVFVQASFTASQAVRDARQKGYAADAAVELAISNVVADRTGDVGAVDGPDCTYTLTGANDVDTTVTCEPFDDSSGAWNTLRARQALLTLSTSEQSITLQGNNPLTVGGAVYSNGDITTAQPDNLLESTWTVRAEGTGGECATDKITAARGKFCATGPAAAGDDPNWALPADSSTALADLTQITCTEFGGKGKGKDKNAPPGGIITFPSGRYVTSPMALLPADCNAHNSILHFPQGKYYFEGFTLTPQLGNKTFHLVAGTPKGNWLTSKSAPNDFSAACDNTVAGAQFVLGELAGLEAAIDLPNEDIRLAICAGPGEGQPPLAISATDDVNGIALQTANKPWIFVYGVVYMPKATVQLNLHNRVDTAYAGGVVVHRLIADVNPSLKTDDPPIFIPTCSVGDPCRTNRRVIFRSTIAGAPALTSVIQFDDDYGNTPAKEHDVQQWSQRR